MTSCENQQWLGANYQDKFCHHGTLQNDYENIVGSSHYLDTNPDIKKLKIYPLVIYVWL